MRALLPALALAVGLGPGSPTRGDEGAYRRADAVVIAVTEEDLNLALRGILEANGGPRLEGVTERASRGISGLHYRAELTEPALSLGEDGKALVSLAIREGAIQIDRMERSFAGRMAHCENLGAVVDPRHPLGVALDLRFLVEDRDLRLVPERVSLSDPRESLRLIGPSRCEKTLLPRWLVWWIGRPRLMRRLERLDSALLTSARSGAASLNGDDGLLRLRWETAGGFLELHPEWLTTGGGFLRLGLASSASLPPDRAAPSPDWTAGPDDRSFVAVSGSFLESALRLAAAGRSETARRPAGDLRRLFRSASAYALVPGLRDVASPEELSIGVTLRSAPEVEVVPAGPGAPGPDPGLEREPPRGGASRPMIRLRVSGLEIRLWEERAGRSELLGVLSVDSGIVGLVPFANRLGGISFATVENAWKLSSSGVEFDEALLAATLQELVFGETFETRYDPLWREALKVGAQRFEPRRLGERDGYLVIELSPVDQANR